MKIIQKEEDDQFEENSEMFIRYISVDTNEIQHQISKEDIQEKVSECTLLSENEKCKLYDILWKHRKVFDKRPGRISVYEHPLIVKDIQNFKGRTYPIPMVSMEKMDEVIRKMLDMDIIRKSTSNFINPILPVIKSDGSIRPVLDARKLNECLEDDPERPPTQEEIFQSCAGITVMSTFDLTSSFWQIPLTEESKKYTAFLHRGRCYEFNVTPFGVKTSTSSLLRAMDCILEGLRNLINFIDDLLLIAKTMQEHWQQIEEFLERVEKHGMTLNFKKMKLFREEVPFLGHILTKEGIKPDKTKLIEIQEYPIPKNVKQLKGFLGLVNFCTKFVDHYAHVVQPLYSLLKKGTKWLWNEEKQKTFDEVKQLFEEVILLYHPDWNKEFIVQTDPVMLQ